MLSFLEEGCSEGVVLGDSGGTPGALGAQTTQQTNVKTPRILKTNYGSSAAADCCLNDDFRSLRHTMKHGEGVCARPRIVARRVRMLRAQCRISLLHSWACHRLT